MCSIRLFFEYIFFLFVLFLLVCLPRRTKGRDSTHSKTSIVFSISCCIVSFPSVVDIYVFFFFLFSSLGWHGAAAAAPRQVPVCLVAHNGKSIAVWLSYWKMFLDFFFCCEDFFTRLDVASAKQAPSSRPTNKIKAEKRSCVRSLLEREGKNGTTKQKLDQR